MKVLIESKSPMVKFSDLKPGEVFRLAMSGDVYMAVLEVRATKPGLTSFSSLSELLWNAVELASGKLMTFGDDILVERLNAALHIR